jgi:hypothetical protein
MLDLTGQRFGRLIVTERREKDRFGHFKWLCKCDCGNEVVVLGTCLVRHTTNSCGCLNDELFKTVLEKTIKENCFDGTMLTAISPTRKINKNNTSGVKGVCPDPSGLRWIAYLYLKKERVYLGTFEKFEDAVNARKRAEEKYFVPILERHGGSSV